MVKPLSDRQLIVLGSSVYVFSSDIHRVWRLPKSETPAWLPDWLALREEGLPQSTIQERIRERYAIPEGELDAIARQLASVELLDADLDDEQRKLPLPETWRQYRWETAWDFHKSMFNQKFLDYAADGARQDLERMHEYIDHEPMPSPFKEVTSTGARVPLHDHLNATPDADGEAPSPASAEGSVDSHLLGLLVNVTFGQIATRQTKALRHEPLLKKTSPSGGARHPTEAYVFVFDVDGIAPGIYHYDVRSNELRLLHAGDHRADFHAFGIRDRDQPRFVPRFGVVLTSIAERSMFRYRGSRSYRVLHYDVGHLLRTFDMVAEAEGLVTYTNYGVDEENLERVLGLSSFEELPIASVVVGRQ